MRKRRESAGKREGEDRSLPAAPTERDEATEKQAGLEDDGFVFWPTTLGEPAGPRLVQVGPRPPREPDKAAPPRRRRAVTAAFTILFFAGAALTAAAGNEVATLVSSSPEVSAVATQTTDTSATESTTVATDATTTDATTVATTTEDSSTSATEPDPAAPSPTTDVTTTAAAATTPAADQPAGGETPQTTTAASTTPAAPASDPRAGAGPDGSQAAPAARPQPEAQPVQVLEPQPAATAPGHKRPKQARAGYASLHQVPKPGEIEPEGGTSAPTGGVHWIDQPLPDPTPASLRLSKEFAQQLREASSSEGLDWAFLLAVLRTERLHSTGEVSLSLLQQKAAALGPLHIRAGDRNALHAYNPDAQFIRRALVLEHYYKAVGLEALVNGLVDSRDALAARTLADQRIEIYPGGREDISSGRVDVRVVAMISFLAESFGDVRVSCLISGHRLYARPGVISAHIYGRGLDIGALDDVSIYGHQQPGSVTARAVKQILLLPAEMLPRQVISLLGFGGPSFPLADHYDHIHIGY